MRSASAALGALPAVLAGGVSISLVLTLPVVVAFALAPAATLLLAICALAVVARSGTETVRRARAPQSPYR